MQFGNRTIPGTAIIKTASLYIFLYKYGISEDHWQISVHFQKIREIVVCTKQYGETNGYLYEIMALFLEPATMASNLQLGPSGPMKAAVSLMEKTKIALLLT